MVTFALVPSLKGWAACLVMLIQTGTRWVTLTQFPVAFSGGRSEKLVPLPGLMLMTRPVNVTPGYMSKVMLTG